MPQAAEFLNIGERCAWNLVRSGELPSLTIGRRRLIDARDLDRFIITRKEGVNARGAETK